MATATRHRSAQLVPTGALLGQARMCRFAAATCGSGLAPTAAASVWASRCTVCRSVRGYPLPYPRCHSVALKPHCSTAGRTSARSSVTAHAVPGSSSSSSSLSLFPAGATQARVVLPAIVLQVGAAELVGSGTGNRSPDQVLEQLSAAVRAGATALALKEDASVGGSGLYEAAVKLKELVASRAALLVVDRVDIAQAVEADGVVLSDAGMPTVVARRMLAAGGGGLIGRLTSSVQAAVQAAADGANLVLLQGVDGGPPDPADLTAARTQQCSGSSIPVLLTSAPLPSGGAPALLTRLANFWVGRQQQVGAASGHGRVPVEGLALDLGALPLAAAALSGGSKAVAWLPLDEAVATVATALRGGFAAPPTASASASGRPGAGRSSNGDPSCSGAVNGDSPASAGSGHSGFSPFSSSFPRPMAVVADPERSHTSAPASAPGSGTWARRLLTGSASEQLLSDEHQVLGLVMAFLEQVVPELSELSLLRDAMSQLDEPFLVVVVGEFNSGKSSVINALLGRKFLAEGILPTTNEISVLRFSSEPGLERKLEQQADGLYVRYLPARLLEEMQIVDTPGTNVILERQQRLTEEYVPRADLVLFVMSADRPLSESEVRFLEYIRQWRKKVVFVVNKVDMLETYDEVKQVKSFVTDNVRRLLRLDDPPVIAVSSRAAIRAKMAAAQQSPQTRVVGDLDASVLARSTEWQASGFGTLERLIYAFLVGVQQQGGAQVAGAGEGVRLKLQTPLFVADALVGAAGKKLGSELAAAEAELASARSIKAQLGRFRADMEKDASAQRDALLKVLGSVTSRMDAYIDRTLALSNALALLEYVTGPKAAASAAQQLNSNNLAKFEAEAVGGSFDRMRDTVAEHTSWLLANCETQCTYYRSFVEQRIDEAASQGRDMRAVQQALQGMPPPKSQQVLVAGSAVASTSLGTADFDITSASSLIESEMREAVVGTASTAFGAPALGLVVTSWIDNAFEDLLVLGVAGAAAYASVLNLPLRRAEIKNKVARLASDFVTSVQSKMKEELVGQLDETVQAIEQLAAPLEETASAEVARLQELEAQRQALASQLQSLMQRAANLA